jgi:hypothetical protein
MIRLSPTRECHVLAGMMYFFERARRSTRREAAKLINQGSSCNGYAGDLVVPDGLGPADAGGALSLMAMEEYALGILSKNTSWGAIIG